MMQYEHPKYGEPELMKKAICPYCECDEWKTARTDLGMPHFKADGMKPTRMQLKRCDGCGHVAIFAPKEDK